MTRRLVCFALASLLASGTPALAQGDKKEDPSDLDKYLTDFNAGTVSAGNLVGLQDSAIQEVQTSQDLIVALKPFSSGSSKRAFGVAITPARTTMTPMSAAAYRRSGLMRFLGSVTLSYAEGNATISSVGYSKSAYSVDTAYYLHDTDDPIIVAQTAFGRCDPGLESERRIYRANVAKEDAGEEKVAAEAELANAGGDEKKKKVAQAKIDAAHDKIAAAELAIKKGPKEAETAFKACIDEDLGKAKWNATRFSVGLGAAYIEPEDRTLGSRKSLGRVLTFGGLVGVGEQAAINLSLRKTSREVDLTTLAGTPAYKSSSLAAARYTWGSKDPNADLKLLAEVSNAKKSEVTESNRVFMYAIGLDKRVGKGTWLQFRLGRNRTVDGTTTEITGLLTLNFAPTAGLFAK